MEWEELATASWQTPRENVQAGHREVRRHLYTRIDSHFGISLRPKLVHGMYQWLRSLPIWKNCWKVMFWNRSTVRPFNSEGYFMSRLSRWTTKVTRVYIDNINVLPVRTPAYWSPQLLPQTMNYIVQSLVRKLLVVYLLCGAWCSRQVVEPVLKRKVGWQD